MNQHVEQYQAKPDAGKHNTKSLQLLLIQEAACRCFLAKILKFPLNLEMILAESTQGQHMYTDNTRANCLPWTQPLGSAGAAKWTLQITKICF